MSYGWRPGVHGIAASLLNEWTASPIQVQTFAESVRMPQPTFPGVPAEPGSAIDEQNGSAPASDVNQGEGLPAERSKFSRWLASFGLGETPIPLLRPRKPPRVGGN